MISSLKILSIHSKKFSTSILKNFSNFNKMCDNKNNCRVEKENFSQISNNEAANNTKLTEITRMFNINEQDYIMNYLIKMSQMNKNKSIRISIEGNIASGKSSLIKFLKKKIESTNQQIITIDENQSRIVRNNSKVNFNIISEPVNSWRNLNGNNLLDLMYTDPHKWAFSFHSYVQLTMLENHLSILKQSHNLEDDENTINIMERSIYSARYCFIENIFSAKILKEVEYEILDKWFNWMISNNDCKLDLVFYLRTDPEVCMQRVLERNRVEEVDRISLDYLKKLHEFHEKWLLEKNNDESLINYYKPKRIIVINANQPADLVYKCVENETRNAVFMKN